MKNNVEQNKKKFIQRITEMMQAPINEMKLSTLDAAIKKAETYKDASLIDRLKGYREYYLNKYREENVKTSFVLLGNIPVVNTKAGRANSSRSIDVTYDFEIYKYIPFENVILVCVPPHQNKRCAAVMITEDGQIENIRDEKLQNDLLKELGCKTIVSTPINWMMDRIQPNSRDVDNKPVRPDRKIAQKFSQAIFTATSIKDADGNIIHDGIKVNWRVFTQTRGKAVVRQSRVEDYVYIGGFNVTDNLKVRVCKYLGVTQPDYRIYPVYIKYFNYAFIMRFRYSLRDIEVLGGAGYGTAYNMLLEKGYLENPPKDPSIQASTIQSNIVNIYQFMKDLQANKYDVDGGDNLCDVILSNISRVIVDKDQAKWDTKVTNHKPLSLDMIKTANDAFMRELNEKRKKDPNAKLSDVENEQLATEEDNEDFGL